MNLLAAAASFGVLVAVFQYGWGLRLLNLGHAGPIESFLPVLMLAVLFGLSMDYEVFLVSRIREEWAATGDNHQAVRTGQGSTGRVIIAAATIMILCSARSSCPARSHRRVRHRPGGRGPARRVRPAHRPGPRPDAPVRPRELVAARLAGPPPLPHLSIEPATQPPAQPGARQRPHPQHAAR